MGRPYERALQRLALSAGRGAALGCYSSSPTCAPEFGPTPTPKLLSKSKLDETAVSSISSPRGAWAPACGSRPAALSLLRRFVPLTLCLLREGRKGMHSDAPRRSTRAKAPPAAVSAPADHRQRIRATAYSTAERAASAAPQADGVRGEAGREVRATLFRSDLCGCCEC